MHVTKEERIQQSRELRAEEPPRFGGRGDAAVEQQLSQHRVNIHLLRQRLSCFPTFFCRRFVIPFVIHLYVVFILFLSRRAMNMAIRARKGRKKTANSSSQQCYISIKNSFRLAFYPKMMIPSLQNDSSGAMEPLFQMQISSIRCTRHQMPSFLRMSLGIAFLLIRKSMVRAATKALVMYQMPL